MKVIVHLEVTDEQRNIYSRKLHPRAEKRLATREEFVTAVQAHVAELVTRPRAGQGQAEKPAPAPVQEAPREAPVFTTDTDMGRVTVTHFQAESIEKHGTGIEASDRSPASRLLESVNNAMHSLSNARRLENTGRRLRINDLLDRVMELREELVEELAREEAA